VYENGARFPFTPQMLVNYGVTRCTHHMEPMSLVDGPGRLPFAVALKTSASFPILIPATTFHCDVDGDQLNPFLHLMDGGLIDNLGIYTAYDLLKQEQAKRKVLLVIDAYKGASRPHSRWEASPSGPEMAFRIMKITLDSEHSRLEKTLAQLQRLATTEGADPTPIEVIVVGFDQLKPDLAREMEDVKQEISRLRKEKARAFVRRIRREIDTALNRDQAKLKDLEDTYALYQDVRAVETSLNITAGQQRLLLRAGAAAVEKNRELIRKYIIDYLAAP
jgi:hypothetical protein